MGEPMINNILSNMLIHHRSYWIHSNSKYKRHGSIQFVNVDHERAYDASLQFKLPSISLFFLLLLSFSSITCIYVYIYMIFLHTKYVLFLFFSVAFILSYFCFFCCIPVSSVFRYPASCILSSCESAFAVWS